MGMENIDKEREPWDEEKEELEEIEEELKEESKKFEKIIEDFINDIILSFPEFKDNIKECYDDKNSLKIEYLFEHCSKVYPERFFDILYRNEEIMKDEDINTCFLPNLDFNKIW